MDKRADGTSSDAPPETSLADTARRLKAIFVGSAGNLVEWFDFYAYSAFALYFAKSFFPSESQTAQLLNAAAIFAVGFLMRPFGGWLFGHIADRHGRRLALTVSVLMMCAGSLIIAVTPTYATIGLAAPFVLLFARLVQGLSLGGEYGTSATYLMRGGASRASRLLFELSVRDADRRAAARHARAAVSAKGAADAGAARRVGLAHSVLHRRRPRGRRLLHAARHARERSVPRSARAGRAGRARSRA